jgi:hypothetical protein
MGATIAPTFPLLLKFSKNRSVPSRPTAVIVETGKLESAEGKDITLPSMTVLRVWRKEMKECQSVDAEHYWKYYNTKGELWVEEVIRLQDFVRTLRFVSGI